MQAHRLTDRQTMSLIELSWTAKKTESEDKDKDKISGPDQEPSSAPGQP